MTSLNTFSKRRKGRPTSFTYEGIPLQLRGQVALILADAFGQWTDALAFLDKTVHREHPTPTFTVYHSNRWSSADPYYSQCIQRGDLNECMDALEIASKILTVHGRDLKRHQITVYSIRQSADDAIAEINERFLEHGIGYQFSIEENQIVRLDSEVIHAEAVEPAIRLLASPGFEGPADEFSKAHHYHRAGDGKEAITWAVKALESTAKAICDQKGWSYKPSDTAKPLLDVLFTNGLVPNELEGHFGGLRSALSSGLPTIGNALARHGQGSTVKPIADHVVTFGMHLAAAAILFLVQAHKATPSK